MVRVGVTSVRGMGRCPGIFLLALALDVGGLTVLFIGVFANVRLGGRALGDCFIYTGAIVIFLSLVAWLFWYTGNVQAPLESLEKDYLNQPAMGSTERSHQPPLGKVVDLDLKELSSTISWELAKQLLQIRRGAEEHPRLVELIGVEGSLDYPLCPVLMQNGDRLV